MVGNPNKALPMMKLYSWRRRRPFGSEFFGRFQRSCAWARTAGSRFRSGPFLRIAPILAIAAISSASALAVAQGVRSDDLIPADAFGYAVVPSVEQFQEQWSQTRLGELFRDPAMEPFGQELQKRLDEEVGQLDRRLGLKWKDLEEVQGGELAMGFSPAPGGGNAVSLLVDITNKHDEAEELLSRINAELTGQQVVARQVPLGNAEATEYTFRPRPGRLRIHKAYYMTYKDWLVASDHLSLLEFVVERLNGKPAATLRGNADFSTVSQRCADAAQKAPMRDGFFAHSNSPRPCETPPTASETRDTPKRSSGRVSMRFARWAGRSCFMRTTAS